MSEKNKTDAPEPVVLMKTGDFVSVLILGGLVGLLIWGVGLLLNTLIFDNYFCQSGAGGQCENAKNYAAVAASVVAGIAALAGLIRLRVYRPLLVMIATVISTWGIAQMSWRLPWYVGVIVAVVLYALAFGAFSWIARVREFWISVVAVIILVVVVRLAITV